tara:strand:+ start:2429 stop:2641 length:213 start_codon:yes stop_codon:yes gene_type:complete
MAEIIEFKPKETVFVLNFTAPNPLKMSRDGTENIALEINKGKGTAWVPASSIRQAQKKLTDMIEITEFTD